ncbi:perlucin-like protein [Mytilus trossulus]|uniref:perlucin-like protein n=1 Tax=Mytilus trossulus TaxID=6551 RepID=UPI0030078E1B
MTIEAMKVFENCYGVYKFEQFYSRRDAGNNILCENGIEFVVNKTSSVVCNILQESTTGMMTCFEESTSSVVICDAGWVKLGNGCYMFTPDGTKHWTYAKTFCNGIGGYLAIIETSEEDELLKSHVAIIDPYKDYWIGGSDLATEGVFIWENTSATVNLPTSTLFQGWEPGQPDNNDENQHCMMLAYQRNFNWNDAKCDYPRDFVCEKN